MSTPLRTGLFRFLALFALGLSFVVLSGCTNSAPRNRALEPQPAKPYYVFALDEIRHLQVVRQYPGEDAWNVKLERDGESWFIRSAPLPLVDHHADTSFVNHLLDTLKTFSAVEPAPRGELSSYGLKPPRARLQWGGSDPKRDFALLLGNEEKTGARFALFAPETSVMIAQGATLQMLAHMQDWQFLRRKVWILGEIDDIDRIEAKTSAKTLAYERAGTGWVDAQKKNRSETLSPALTNLVHQRVKRFIDTKEETTELDRRLTRSPDIELHLADRRDRAQVLKIYRDQAAVFGKNEMRGNAWFELFPEILQPLSAFTQSGSTPRKSGTK